MQIEINGVQYEQIEKVIPKTNKRISKFLLMALAFSSFDPYGQSSKNTEHPKVDLISEFELIQQKKSKLTRREREWVVNSFYRNFKEINK